MNKVIIYSLSDPVSGVVKYIGQTSKTLNERIKSHLKDAKYKKNNKRIAWINSLTKKGNIPVIEIIDEVPEEDWIFWEMYWIEQFKIWGFELKNGTKGGDGTKGKPCSWKKKYGEDHHRFGKKHSEETKEKMMNPIGQFNKKGELIKEWKGIKEAAEGVGVDVGNINKVCRGKRKTAGGYIWKYRNRKGLV